jgi:hypothetical protein
MKNEDPRMNERLTKKAVFATKNRFFPWQFSTTTAFQTLAFDRFG